MILNNQFLLFLIVRQQFRVKNSSNRTSCLIHDDKMIRERCVTISEKILRKFILILTFIKCKVEHIPIHMQAVQHRYSDTRPRHDNMEKTWDSNQKFRNRESPSNQVSQSSQKLNHEHVEFCNFEKRFEKSQKYNDKKRERGLYLLQCYLGCLISLSCFSRLDRKEREREKTDIYK